MYECDSWPLRNKVATGLPPCFDSLARLCHQTQARGQKVSCIWKESPRIPSFFPRSCPDVNLIGSVRSQTAEVLDPLPDLPISSQRNSTNESLWGTDAAGAAGRKTTCHTHSMITRTKAVMSHDAFCLCACLCTLKSHSVGCYESLQQVRGWISKQRVLIHAWVVLIGSSHDSLNISRINRRFIPHFVKPGLCLRLF